MVFNPMKPEIEALLIVLAHSQATVMAEVSNQTNEPPTKEVVEQLAKAIYPMLLETWKLAMGEALEKQSEAKKRQRGALWKPGRQ